MKRFASALVIAVILPLGAPSLSAQSSDVSVPVAHRSATLESDPRPTTQERSAPRYSVRRAQLFLNMTGYGDLVEDGIAGRKTRRAIRAFQRSYNLPVNGRLTGVTRSKLATAAGRYTLLTDPCGYDMEYRDKGFVMSCSLSSWLDISRWSSWTGVRATGTGILNQRACDPSCVEDTNVTSTRVRVMLDRPERWRCGDGRPYQMFTRMRITDQQGYTWSVPVSEFYSC